MCLGTGSVLMCLSLPGAWTVGNQQFRGVGNGEFVSAMFWVPVKVLLVDD